MNLNATHSGTRNPFQVISRVNIRSNSVYTLIIILALVAFEAFNYGTTAYALKDLLGDLRFAGIQWATLMALAFCGLDFAGIARLINQKGRSDDRKESWYLFSAWLIAAAFNAALTWWGVSIAINNHALTSSLVANTQNLTTIVPVLVAVMVWVIRILIIGSLTSALEQTRPNRSQTERQRTTGFPLNNQTVSTPARAQTQPHSQPVRPATPRPLQGQAYKAYTPASNRPQNEFMAAENRSRDF